MCLFATAWREQKEEEEGTIKRYKNSNFTNLNFAPPPTIEEVLNKKKKNWRNSRNLKLNFLRKNIRPKFWSFGTPSKNIGPVRSRVQSRSSRSRTRTPTPSRRWRQVLKKLIKNVLRGGVINIIFLKILQNSFRNNAQT